MNHRTQTPVNAVWFVVVSAGMCGLLGFSETALVSLAGCAPGEFHPPESLKLTLIPLARLLSDYIPPMRHQSFYELPPVAINWSLVHSP
jgi:hypothetical protein